MFDDAKRFVLEDKDVSSVGQAITNLYEGDSFPPYKNAKDPMKVHSKFLTFWMNYKQIGVLEYLAGFENLSDKGVDFSISMTQIPETIQLACVMKDNWVLPIFDNLESGLTNSKFIKKYYKPSGAFYFGRWDKILTYRNFFKGNVKGVMIPAERSVDINSKADIDYAEQVLRDSQ